MGRLRSYLLLTLVIGVLVGWAAAIDSGRLFDTWAYFSDKETDTGNTITADTLGAPSSLTVSAGGSSSQIVLNWTASNDSYATHYQVFRCSGSSCAPATQIADSPLVESSLGGTCSTPSGACTYTNTGLQGGTTYCYKVVTAYLISSLVVWTSGSSNTACDTTNQPYVSRNLKLHSSGAMDTSSASASSVTIAGGGTNFFEWGYNPGVASTLGPSTWTLNLALDSPTQSGNTTNILVTVKSSSCSGSVVTTLVNTTVNLPQVAATTGVTLSLTPSGAASIAAGQVLCLKLTNLDTGVGGPHTIKVVTDSASTLPIAGLISGLTVAILP